MHTPAPDAAALTVEASPPHAVRSAQLPLVQAPVPMTARELASTHPDAPGEPMLVVSHLSKAFAGREVVSDVSFNVAAGEVFAFLGQNGAGKTTTIKMCSGLLSPDAGTIRINGLDPQKGSNAAAHIGALLEGNRNLYWRMTPLENLRYFGVLKGMTIADATTQGRMLLQRFDLDPAHRQVQQLSRGMMQKLAIAVAMLNHPKVLFLDEPTLGLDVGSVAQMLKMIRVLAAEGTAIILTTHQLDIAEALSDRISIIHRGRIIKFAQTEALTREFSPSGFEIRLERELDADVQDRIERDFGAHAEGDTVYFAGDDERLYDVLQALRPAAIAHVGRRRADLTNIFLRLTGGQDAA